MKRMADNHRRDLTFKVGDWVYEVTPISIDFHPTYLLQVIQEVLWSFPHHRAPRCNCLSSSTAPYFQDTQCLPCFSTQTTPRGRSIRGPGTPAIKLGQPPRHLSSAHPGLEAR